MTYIDSGFVDSFQCLQQRSLVVQRFTGVGDKDGRDTQGVSYDEGRRGGIPSGVATSLEGVTDTTVREAGGIRFLLDQQLAVELFDDATLSIMLYKGIMFFSRTLCQRMEPVGVVGSSLFQGPFLHACSHSIGYFAIEGSTVVDTVDQFLINLFRQILKHLCPVEDQLAIILGRTLCLCWSLDSLFAESCLYHSES